MFPIWTQKKTTFAPNKGDKISKAIFSVTFHDKFFDKLNHFVHSLLRTEQSMMSMETGAEGIGESDSI